MLSRAKFSFTTFQAINIVFRSLTATHSYGQNWYPGKGAYDPFGLSACADPGQGGEGGQKSSSADDPVQRLFLEKIREYKTKSADGKLVDPSPAILKELSTEMEKLERQYGGAAGEDMNQFPTFKFEEPKLDPIDEPDATADPKKK